MTCHRNGKVVLLLYIPDGRFESVCHIQSTPMDTLYNYHPRPCESHQHIRENQATKNKQMCGWSTKWLCVHHLEGFPILPS